MGVNYLVSAFAVPHTWYRASRQAEAGPECSALLAVAISVYSTQVPRTSDNQRRTIYKVCMGCERCKVHERRGASLRSCRR